MAYVKITFVDRIAEYPGRRKLSTIDTAQVFGVYDVERDEGQVSQEGTPLNAATFNALQNNIAAAFGKDLTETLTAGQTTVTFTDPAINENSKIDFFVSIAGVWVNSASVTGTTLTLTFDAQAEDMTVSINIK